MSVNKRHLIASSGTLQQMAEMIQKKLYWKEPAKFVDNNDGTWAVYFPDSSPKAGNKLNYIIRQNKNRFRLEL